ncbi:DNA repair protein [Marinilongibacter aquaticus]|uniref:CRISPR-associated endonuclease Cas6 n=1 Tax=Marinilongibacter aquaticus TaxID=2975157 RepID=UPI0021BDC4C9|nr:CRISPR-associated endonuclease Cas6 [Marinilongibacter aquaticus]UBM60790.1 DNA repair protein [Marinilongibacter aquaticus]
MTMPHPTAQITRIAFPEIALRMRDAHKLRGYFGNLFKEQSPLLSNHFSDGTLRYRYPLIQYKVVDKIPMLVGIGEGGDLLVELFLKVTSLDIGGNHIPVLSKNINRQEYTLGVDSDLHEYRFATSWMALNQENYQKYNRYSDDEKECQLKQILKRNVLNVYSVFRHKEPEQIMVNLNVNPHPLKFKNQNLLGFSGGFVSNALIPDYLGLGKSPSRGFGTIVHQK